MRVADDIAALEAEAQRIVEAICAERTPDAQIDARIAALRERATGVFPGNPEVFDAIWARRFQRLRRRFRPSPGLFAGGTNPVAGGTNPVAGGTTQAGAVTQGGGAGARVSPASASTRA